jgi:hypothetical protein
VHRLCEDSLRTEQETSEGLEGFAAPLVLSVVAMQDRYQGTCIQ